MELPVSPLPYGRGSINCGKHRSIGMVKDGRYGNLSKLFFRSVESRSPVCGLELQYARGRRLSSNCSYAADGMEQLESLC